MGSLFGKVLGFVPIQVWVILGIAATTAITGGGWYIKHLIDTNRESAVKMAIVEKDRDAAWSAVNDYAARIHELDEARANVEFRLQEARKSERDDIQTILDHDVRKIVKERPDTMARLLNDSDAGYIRMQRATEQAANEFAGPQGGSPGAADRSSSP